MRAHGACVRLSEPGEPAVHLKAAVVDGRAFLDDRNWPADGRATVVEIDDVRAVRAIADAIDGHPRADANLALQKSAALALEAATIASAPGDRVDVATESFGSSVVSAALCARARAGAAVRVTVDSHALAGDAHGRERAAIARLTACGVTVRAAATAQKFAVAGDRVWVGSANATAAGGAMLDWGVATGGAGLAGSFERVFEQLWSRGVPVTGQPPKSAAAVASVRAPTSATGSSSSVATNAAVSRM
ncbi:MAG: hypothetical protein NVS3B16_23870 [Vulcanimicrobiaceae bacterium]